MEQEDINGARGKKFAIVRRETISGICILDYDSLSASEEQHRKSIR